MGTLMMIILVILAVVAILIVLSMIGAIVTVFSPILVVIGLLILADVVVFGAIHLVRKKLKK